MRLLVTGPTGQLGADLLRAAAAAGLEATGLGRRELDLARPAGVAAALEPHAFDVLVHAAAFTAVDAAEDQAGRAFAVNTHAVRALAEACRARGARLVHVSTDYVFAGRAGRPYREADTPGPLNVYGASKLAGERYVLAAPGALVVRTASLFGVEATRRPGGGNFIETILRRAREGAPLRVVDDIRMSPTHTADVAAAVLALLEAGAEGLVHVASRDGATWHELAAAALAAEDLDVPVAPVPATSYPTRARRPADSRLDVALAEALIGPLPTWHSALTAYLSARSRER